MNIEIINSTIESIKQATMNLGKSSQTRARELKEEGNSLFACNDFNGAIIKYTEAISLDNNQPAFYLNRR